MTNTEGKPAPQKQRGTTRQSFRCDPETWNEFRKATGGNATSVLMSFIRWYIGRPKSPMPRRPRRDQIDGGT